MKYIRFISYSSADRSIGRALHSALAGGTLALLQTQTANERLARSIGSAARIVDIAAGFRDHFGIPSSATQELFVAVDPELKSIEADATQHPLLSLEKGNTSCTWPSFPRISANGPDPAR